MKPPLAFRDGAVTLRVQLRTAVALLWLTAVVASLICVPLQRRLNGQPNAIEAHRIELQAWEESRERARRTLDDPDSSIHWFMKNLEASPRRTPSEDQTYARGEAMGEAHLAEIQRIARRPPPLAPTTEERWEDISFGWVGNAGREVWNPDHDEAHRVHWPILMAEVAFLLLLGGSLLTIMVRSGRRHGAANS